MCAHVFTCLMVNGITDKLLNRFQRSVVWGNALGNVMDPEMLGQRWGVKTFMKCVLQRNITQLCFVALIWFHVEIRPWPENRHWARWTRTNVEPVTLQLPTLLSFLCETIRNDSLSIKLSLSLPQLFYSIHTNHHHINTPAPSFTLAWWADSALWMNLSSGPQTQKGLD